MNAVDLQHLVLDFVESRREPPYDSPAKQPERNQSFALGHVITMAPEIPRAEQAGDADENATQIKTVEHRHCAARRWNIQQKSAAGGELQQRSEPAYQKFLLTHADPDNGGAFERPGCGCPPPIKPERDR